MVEVSEQLRAARERAGLRIADISARTKIKAVQLEAIERGEFERLPGEFFTRAFLRNYAREVGLSPDEIIRHYDASRGVPERTPAAVVTAAPLGSRAWRAASMHGPDADPDEPANAGRAPLLSPRAAWPALAVALLVLLVVWTVNRPSEISGEAGAVSTTGVAESGADAAATSGAAAPPAAAPEALSMEIQPTAEIWINARADGEQAIYRLVKPGERLKVEARNELTFRIGNAAAFEYTINGVPGRALGGPDQVREFQITRDNIHTYRR